MINEIQKLALYEKYLAIHKAYHADPEFFTLIQSNTELTTVMGGKFWSWHVVGITKLALLKYMELGFRHKARSGITRAHLIPRIVSWLLFTIHSNFSLTMNLKQIFYGFPFTPRMLQYSFLSLGVASTMQ